MSELAFRGADGLALRGESFGPVDAPPVLLLHGGGQTRHAWSGTAERLAAAGRRAITLDLRGHGDSQWAPDGSYRLEAFAEDVRAVVAALNAPAALIGASLGGLVILLAAGEAPAALASAVVLVDVAPRLERSGTDRIVGFMTERADGFGSLEEAAEHVARFTGRREVAPRGLRRVLRQGDDGRWRWHWDPRFMTEAGPAEVRDKPRLFAAARNLRAPALLVRGRESDVLSEAGAAELMEHLVDAELVDVSRAGHAVAGERNDAFSRAVLAFLTRSA